ncbi:hypothetical protein OAB83_00220 [Candidatus Pelagibacter sp.]|nr:hypothetical protein [Candidatus Pelagibacter sp.]
MEKELLALLINSKKTYDNYIINGKIFLYAKKLRLINQKILNLIKKLNFEKNNKLKKPTIDLKKHIEDWAIIWDREKSIRNPEDNDVFIFTSYKKYPKDLELLLINRFK